MTISPTAAIQVNRLNKNYTGEKALREVSFSVDIGSLYGLIGADGAGKSTLIKILATIVNPDSGTAQVLGKDCRTGKTGIRSNIGYMPQRFSLYQDLSVSENLQFFADIFSVPKKERKERFDHLLSFSRLTQFQERRAGNLSGGMKQKLALCCALIHTPKLLILDEPTTGVDPVSRKEFWEILFLLKKQGVTILVSTPYMDEAARCDDLLLLDRGQIVCSGTPQYLLSTYPHDLFRIISHRTISISETRNIYLPPIRFMYPAQGAMHIACDRNQISPEMLFRQIQTIFPLINGIEPKQPEIEDFFIYTLMRRQQEEMAK